MAATVARRSIGVGGSVSMSYMRGFACIHVVLSMRLQDDANRRGEKTQFAVHCWPWRPCAEDDAVTSLSCILVFFLNRGGIPKFLFNLEVHSTFYKQDPQEEENNERVPEFCRKDPRLRN